jgi:hypothetical protein
MATFHVEVGARTFVATIAATVFFRFSGVFGERVPIFASTGIQLFNGATGFTDCGTITFNIGGGT